MFGDVFPVQAYELFERLANSSKVASAFEVALDSLGHTAHHEVESQEPDEALMYGLTYGPFSAKQDSTSSTADEGTFWARQNSENETGYIVSERRKPTGSDLTWAGSMPSSEPDMTIRKRPSWTRYFENVTMFLPPELRRERQGFA